MRDSRRQLMIVVALGLLWVVVIAAAPFLGRNVIPIDVLWSDGGVQGVIFWQMRVPRVLIAVLAGSGLATAGMVLQAMLRNPLAEPFTLGISSGASLGAALAILGSVAFEWRGFSTVSLCAFAGALAVVGLVYGLSRLRRGFSTATMLLAGVAISFFCSSLILLLQYQADFTQVFRMLRWVMGGVDRVVNFREVVGLLPFLVAGFAIVLYHTHALNLLATGDDLAASRGVDLKATRLALFFGSSLMVAAVVALCGPIGFVGLMAPHIARLLVGPDHRWLLPATWLFGGVFLVVCDTVARIVLFPNELPVGILTALLGGPFFLWLLLGLRLE